MPRANERRGHLHSRNFFFFLWCLFSLDALHVLAHAALPRTACLRCFFSALRIRSFPRERCYVPDVAEAVAVSALTGDAEIPPPPGGLMTATFKQKVRTSVHLGMHE